MLDIKHVELTWTTLLSHDHDLYQSWSCLISMPPTIDDVSYLIKGWPVIMVDWGWYRAWWSMITSLIKVDEVSILIKHDVSTLMHCIQSWLVHQAWFVMVYVQRLIHSQAWSSLMYQAWLRLSAHQSLINLDINIDEWLMNYQHWSSMCMLAPSGQKYEHGNINCANDELYKFKVEICKF